MTLPPRYRPRDGADATAWALAIHRHVEPRQWPEALEDVPQQHHAEVERYLRDMAHRMRVARNLRAQREATGARRA